jgi:type II secretory pathway pseudopilin PulG
MRDRIRSERGYSIFELLVVMVVMVIVLAALTTFFVSATRSQVNAGLRFQAQQNAQLGLGALRRDVDCSSAIAAGWSASSVTLTLPAGCPGGSSSSSTQVSWCTVSSSGHYQLFRQGGTSCGSSGTLEADYLTSGSAFAYTCSSGSNLLPVLTVTLPVNVDPTKTTTYTLAQDIAFRNANRC